MDFPVNKLMVYDIADALGMLIELDYASGTLHGTKEKPVWFENVRATFRQRLACSLLQKNSYMAMASIVGNLALLVITSAPGDDVTAHVLNLAKMDHLDTWLPNKKPKDRKEALSLLGNAVVASFSRNHDKTWTPS